MIDKDKERVRLLANRPETLGERISAVIGRGRLLSAAQVSDELDITRQAISNWKGDERIDIAHFKPLARLSGLPLTWWLPGSDEGVPDAIGTEWPFPEIKPERLVPWKGSQFLADLQIRMDELLSQAEQGVEHPRKIAKKR